MDKPSELKPCPFCGSVAMTKPHPGVCEYVECQACNAYGPAADPDGLAWNRRTPDRAALVEVARRARVDFAIWALRMQGAEQATIDKVEPKSREAVEVALAELIVTEYLAEQERTDAAD